MERQLFHRLLKPEEALKLILEHFNPRPTGVELVHISEAHGRVLAEHVASPIDVPPFDRATMDGYAVRSIDVEDASEISPVELKLIGKVEAGQRPNIEVVERTCVEVATGAPVPAGADSVVMVEYTSMRDGKVLVYRSTYPGENIAFVGTDVVKGEIILRRCTRLSYREIALLASVGVDKVPVYSRPRVGIIATGNELVEPGSSLDIGKIYNSNTYMLNAACIEEGCVTKIYGICPDDEKVLRELVEKAVKENDIVLITGGTSAGTSDITYRVLGKLGNVLIHGLLIKPGKPTVIADVDGKPVIGLPGYPNSALLVFDLIVRPLIRRMLCSEDKCEEAEAILVKKIIGAQGRRAYIPAIIVERNGKLLAYPLEAPQGSISPVVNADGYIIVPEDREFIDEGEKVKIILERRERPDLIVIGSHDYTLDKILTELAEEGYKIRQVVTGSMGAIIAVSRGIADLGGIHIIDEETGKYNEPIIRKLGIEDKVILVKGWKRLQGIIVQKGNPKNIKSIEDFLRPDVKIVNRNKGSGTRHLLDLYLKQIAQKQGIPFQELVRKIRGYTYEVKTHTAVAAAIAQGKADAGIGIKQAAELYNLDFIPLTYEEYDIIINRESIKKKAVQRLLEILQNYNRDLF
ncbi:MAG: molybdopterin biosynthesis protein [Crenarchaeota archaeon]|nr:molybdopterin biosynthesis protein [Thermoproteota archaeon]